MTVIFERFYYYSVYFFFIDIYCILLLLHSLGFIYIYIFVSLSLFPLSLSFIDSFDPLVYHVYIYLAAASLVSSPPLRTVLLSILRFIRRGFLILYFTYLLVSGYSPLKQLYLTDRKLCTELRNQSTFAHLMYLNKK